MSALKGGGESIQPCLLLLYRVCAGSGSWSTSDCTIGHLGVACSWHAFKACATLKVLAHSPPVAASTLLTG
jgi:hypothetical protein